MPDKNLSDYSWQSRVVMGHLLRLSGPGGGGQEPWGSYFELQCEFPLTSASSENATRAAHPQALFPWQQGAAPTGVQATDTEVITAHQPLIM